MAGSLRISNGLNVPAAALSFRAVRAAGPGGQNVNKVASKVELSLDLHALVGLDAEARRRLLQLAGRRVNRGGRLVVTSQRTRDQGRNLADAREKMRVLLERSLQAPRPRHATRRTLASQRKRLAAKRTRGRLKADRGDRGTVEE